MKRCLELAKNGLAKAMPNPSVGAVLVCDGQIIGEGSTDPYGGPHGEVNCINSVKKEDEPLIERATLYVSLEPCNHFGKTPPCADLVVQKKIPNVVVACTDPFEKVAGQGIAKLEKAGIKVRLGVLEKEAKELNRRFFTAIQKNRPYIVLKWAQTQDGFIAKNDDKQNWISNRLCKKLSHKWRTEEMAIMVGTNTVLIDNPQLTAREWTGKNPVRVAIDRNLRFDTPEFQESLYLFDRESASIVFTEKDPPNEFYHKIACKNYGEKELIPQILSILHQKQIQSVIVEGGATLLASFIDANLWDEARVFVGNVFFGKGLNAPNLLQTPSSQEKIGDNLLYYYRNLF